MTRSAPAATIFSTSTPLNVPTIGTPLAAGGKFAMSSTLPTTLGPAPIAKRISVSAGVSDTTLRGSAFRATVVPSSSVRLVGKAGDGDADGGAVTVRGGRSEPVASGGTDGRGVAPPPQAATMIAIK